MLKNGVVVWRRSIICQKKERGAEAIEKPDGNKRGKNAEQRPVKVKAVFWPRLDPGKPVVLEQKSRTKPRGRDLVPQKDCLRHHHQTKRDPKKDQ
jgi:hypothetical protein